MSWPRAGVLAGMRLAGLWLLVGSALAAAGCSRTLPPDRSAAALYRDLERLVTVNETIGWRIDRLEIEGLISESLMSVCQVEPAKRVMLRNWLEARITALGGPVEAAYQARNQDLDLVDELLTLTRVQLTLTQSMDLAADDCPFWLRPQAEFTGRQIADDRWQAVVGGGGQGTLMARGDDRDVQFGGAGRLVLGRSIGRQLGIYAGLQAGGTASFPRTDNGNRSNLVLNIEVVAPVVVRYRILNTYAEVEAGYLALVEETALTDIEHGVHFGVSVGGRALRVRWFFPGVIFSIAYERTFPGSQDGPPLHMLKVGARAGFDIDF